MYPLKLSGHGRVYWDGFGNADHLVAFRPLERTAEIDTGERARLPPQRLHLAAEAAVL